MLKLVEHIIEELKKEDIIIQRYDAKSTNSIYLKLDYGVLNTIRISDHQGKDKLHYRYNLLSYTSKSEYDFATKRFYYNFENVDKMIEQIKSDHWDRIKRYGDNYEVYMERNIQQNQHKKGFWQEATIV